MKRATATLLVVSVLAAGLLVAARAEGSPEDFGFRSFDEVLRSDIRAKHEESIMKIMVLSEKETEAFWPIFRDYERELTKLNDEKRQILKDYVQNYESLTDEKANELAERSLDWQAGRVKLMRNYYRKFSKALSPKAAAKFFQAENQFWLFMDLQIASELPLVK